MKRNCRKYFCGYRHMQKNVYRHSLVGLLLLILCIFPYEGRAQRFDDHKKNSQIVWDNKVLDSENYVTICFLAGILYMNVKNCNNFLKNPKV